MQEEFILQNNSKFRDYKLFDLKTKLKNKLLNN